MKFAFYNGSDGVYRLITENPTLVGGTSKQQWVLAQALIEHGHEVVIITPTSDPESIKPAIDGIRFYPSPARTTNLQLARIFTREKPDWLYWCTNSMHLGPVFFIAKRFGVKTIYSIASDKDCDPKRALNPYNRTQYFWRLYQWGLKQADVIFLQHPGQGDLLGPKYAHQTSLVTYIVPPPPAIKKAADEPPYIVWVANLRHEKRPDLLVEIASKLPDLKFVVCGAVMEFRSQPGYAKAVSEQLVKLPNVDYRGPVALQDALAAIAGASLFLSTSGLEGFPNTMLEAWSVGVPVISLKLGLGGTIVKYDLGRVTDDVDDTVKAIRELMDNPQELSRLGENGRCYVAEHHSSAAVYNQLTNALGIRQRI